MDIARDLKTVAWSSGMQCDVNIENVNSNEPVFHVDGNKGKYVSAIALSHDDQWAALAIVSKIDVWNRERKKKIAKLDGHNGKVHSVAFGIAIFPAGPIRDSKVIAGTAICSSSIESTIASSASDLAKSAS